MRIDRIQIENFDGFGLCEFDLDPHFNLLIGDNAAGKSSAADALAIAVGSWFLGIRGYARPLGISADEVRVVARQFGDRWSFEKQFPSRVEACGNVFGRKVTWARVLRREGGRTSSLDARALSDAAHAAEVQVRSGEDIALPLICTYGTERLWFEVTHRKPEQKKAAELRRVATLLRKYGDVAKAEELEAKAAEISPQKTSKQPPQPPDLGLPSRLDGYRDCIDFTIQESFLLEWIQAEVSVGEQRRQQTTALAVFKTAVTECVEGATDIYYDPRYKDAVIVMGNNSCLFGNLSDGQRIMLTLVGDLARRAITLNPQMGKQVLRQTVGVVIIDELDLHLHPKWQRHVIHDLKRTFPLLQFVATTHSPQLIGEALPHEIRRIDGDQVTIPMRSYGIDSSRILEELMNATPRNTSVKDQLLQLFDAIDNEDFDVARDRLGQVEKELGPDDPEVTRARTLMSFLESKA